MLDLLLSFSGMRTSHYWISVQAISIVAQQPFGPPCSKSHVWRHFEASEQESFAPSKHTKRRRVTLVTKAPGCPRAALIKGPLRGAKLRLKSNAFSFGCSHWRLTDCSLETCCSSPRVSRLLQSKSDPEGLPCWSHPHSHSRSPPCRTRSRSARFFWVFGSPLTAAVD